MTGIGLKSVVDSKFSPPPISASSAHVLFSEALEEYLESDCVVTYSWAAVDGIGNPDPTTSFTAKPTWVDFSVSTPSDLEDWASKITAEVYTAVIEPDDTSFSFSPSLIFGNVLISLSFSNATTQSAAMLYICNEIVDGVKDMIAPGTFAGTHGIYTGTATMVSIS